MSYELVDGLTIREIKEKFDRCELLEGICENQLETMENQAKTIDDQLEVIEEYSDRVVALEKLLYEIEHKLEETISALDSCNEHN